METALPLQQHPCFADALTRLGRRVQFFDVDGAAPVLAVQQFGQWMASRGPVWQDDTGDADALRPAGLRLINADRPCDAALRGAGFRRLMTPAHVAELDLTGPATDRQARMQPKWRNAWRRAQEADLTVTDSVFDPQAHQWILDADRAQQRSKGFRGLPHILIGAYAARHPKAVQVWIAQDSDRPIAAMLFLLHKPVATYHIGWTDARGRALRAHHRMIIAAADHFAERGFRRLDLGLVDTDNAPGLARFKIGTGAQVRSLGGTWLRLPGF